MIVSILCYREIRFLTTDLTIGEMKNGFTFSFGRNNKTAGRAAGVESVALAALVHCESIVSPM